MKIQCKYLPEFGKELKKLSKKFASLEADLENFQKFISAVDFENNKRFITLYKDDHKKIRIVKTRLMVRSLKGSSKTRIIFAFCFAADRIDFLEIYLKKNQEREDQQRIQNYIASTK